MKREASTRREKKPLKLNVSRQTLDYLLECDRGRFWGDRGGLPLLNTY